MNIFNISLIMFSSVIGKYMLMVRSFLGFFVTTAIIYCWIKICIELRKLEKIGNCNSQTRRTWQRKVKRKVTEMFFAVVVSLYICYIPLWIRAVAHGFNALEYPIYEIFAISLVLANSSINPIIYSFTSKTFRNELFRRKSLHISR